MRIRIFLVMTAACSIGAGIGIQACGGTSDSGTTTADAAPETSTKDSSHPDTSMLPDVADARPPCDPNKDVLKDIPDAEIPDSGTTTGICLGCAVKNCKMQIDDCKHDCSRSPTDLGCQDLVAKALTCYAAKHDFFMCGGDFIGAKSPTQGIGIALGSCVGGACQSECGVPKDAGSD